MQTSIPCESENVKTCICRICIEVIVKEDKIGDKNV